MEGRLSALIFFLFLRLYSFTSELWRRSCWQDSEVLRQRIARKAVEVHDTALFHYLFWRTLKQTTFE